MGDLSNLLVFCLANDRTYCIITMEKGQTGALLLFFFGIEKNFLK